MAGALGWVSLGQVLPRGSRPQYPKDTVQHLPGIPRRSPRRSRLGLRLRKVRSHQLPLFVCEVHAFYIDPPNHLIEVLGCARISLEVVMSVVLAPPAGVPHALLPVIGYSGKGLDFGLDGFGRSVLPALDRAGAAVGVGAPRDDLGGQGPGDVLGCDCREGLLLLTHGASGPWRIPGRLPVSTENTLQGGRERYNTFWAGPPTRLKES